MSPLAGTTVIGNGGQATQALLKNPLAVIREPNGGGSLAILDSANMQIRRITATGTIQGIARLSVPCYDMAPGRDGSFYLTAPGRVIRVNLQGQTTVVAGSGAFGRGPDGPSATSVPLTALTAGITVDPAGNIYFVDENRVRLITTSGAIRTVAGVPEPGFRGDGGPATSAMLNNPWGIALDPDGNLFISDNGNLRVRRVSASSGNISTVAGNGQGGTPLNGSATSSPLRGPFGITTDDQGNVIFTDGGAGLVLRINTSGVLSRVAGGAATNTGDGSATGVSLDFPVSVSRDPQSGAYYVAEFGNHRIRQIDGFNIRTIAGRIRYAGDGGPAQAAVLNSPNDIAVDTAGATYIADPTTFRIRKIGPDGVINSWAGTGVSGLPSGVNTANRTAIPRVTAIASGGDGNIYFAASVLVYRITAAGVMSIFAGTGVPGNAGDGGPATAATFRSITGLAVDAAGNVYIGDSGAVRVRKVAANSGSITAFAGSGVAGFTGDDGPSTTARLGASTVLPLAVDADGKVYIGDGGNFRVRAVDPESGKIATILGNGQNGDPEEGAEATLTRFRSTLGLTVSPLNKDLFITAANQAIYQVSGGVVRLLPIQEPAPSTPALPPLATTTNFEPAGIRADSQGDLIVADSTAGVVRKLVQNSPKELLSLDGNRQSALPGNPLPALMRLRVAGRAGTGVVNEPVHLEVLAGSASLESDSVLTGENGVSEFPVIVGPDGGPILVSASLPGSGLAPLLWYAAGTVLLDYSPGGTPPDARRIASLPGTTGAEATVDGDVALSRFG